MTDVLQPSSMTGSSASTSEHAGPAVGNSESGSAWPSGVPTHMTFEEYLAWDQEGMNNGLAVGTPPRAPTLATGSSAIKTQAQFLHWLSQRRDELGAPTTVRVMP